MRRAVLLVTAIALFAASLRPGGADTTVSGPITFSTGLAVGGSGAVTLSTAPITATLGGDVALNNTGGYFDGPSIAQGSTGTFWVCSSVTVVDTSAAAIFLYKLWDGTNTVATGRVTSPAAGSYVQIVLCGAATAPAGNLRISVRDFTSTNGTISAGASGLGKDSTITAIRIQ